MLKHMERETKIIHICISVSLRALRLTTMNGDFRQLPSPAAGYHYSGRSCFRGLGDQSKQDGMEQQWQQKETITIGETAFHSASASYNPYIYIYIHHKNIRGAGLDKAHLVQLPALTWPIPVTTVL